MDSKAKDKDYGELVPTGNKGPGLALLQSTEQDLMGATSFGPDGKADNVIQVLAAGTSPVIAVLVQNMGGKAGSWKTKGATITTPGLLMVRIDGKIINAADAVFNIDVQEPLVMEVILQDNGALADTNTRMRVVLYHADGSRPYALIKR